LSRPSRPSMEADAAGGNGWCRTFEPLVAGMVESKSGMSVRVGPERSEHLPLGSASLTMISVPVIGSLTRLCPCSAFLYRSVGRSVPVSPSDCKPRNTQPTLV
jgi:hypothetical protein